MANGTAELTTEIMLNQNKNAKLYMGQLDRGMRLFRLRLNIQLTGNVIPLTIYSRSSLNPSSEASR